MSLVRIGSVLAARPFGHTDSPTCTTAMLLSCGLFWFVVFRTAERLSVGALIVVS
jgi:hypothetical protein